MFMAFNDMSYNAILPKRRASPSTRPRLPQAEWARFRRRSRRTMLEAGGYFVVRFTREGIDQDCPKVYIDFRWPIGQTGRLTKARPRQKLGYLLPVARAARRMLPIGIIARWHIGPTHSQAAQRASRLTNHRPPATISNKFALRSRPWISCRVAEGRALRSHDNRIGRKLPVAWCQLSPYTRGNMRFGVPSSSISFLFSTSRERGFRFLGTLDPARPTAAQISRRLGFREEESG